MKYIDVIRIAFAALKLNITRGIITVFIIALGIASLISMLTAVDGIKASLFASFSQMGSNSFTMVHNEGNTRFKKRGFNASSPHRITFKQAEEFKRRSKLKGIISISDDVYSDAVVKYQSTKTNPKIPIKGSDENYLTTSGLTLAEGRNFTPQEVERGVNVCIIGNKLKEDLFGKQTALQEFITVGSQRFMVIGILQSKGSSFGGGQDNTVIVSLLSGRNCFPITNTTSYTITAQIESLHDVDPSMEEAQALFRTIRRLPRGVDDDFTITKSDALYASLDNELIVIEFIAIFIGIITLIGAAVGLTNIMLVSVTERTREIGTRKAMGATKKNIRTQFLWEAIVISQLGGITGIILGISLGNLISNYFEGSFVFPINWTILGFVVCTVVGVISGIFPAIRASKLDPIESLRYE
ncbi:MAG: ABC transporter permease [Bacteroidetes bacterium]|nr:ABC transporter permease [Bacteroidota bacterium]